MLRVIFVSAALLLVLLPGAVMLMDETIVPPGESRMLYAGFVTGLSVLSVLFIYLNKNAIATWWLQRWKLFFGILITLFAVSLAARIYLTDYLIVRVPDRTSVFFPLWMQGELKTNVAIRGGRERFLEAYGTDLTRTVIQRSSASALFITRFVFLFAITLNTLTVSVAFLALSFRYRAIVAKPVRHRLFFSYAWGGEKEKLVEELYRSLLNEKTYDVVRDKEDNEYAGLITDFIAEIGRGRLVIVAISDKYLRSRHCMFELYELYRHSDSDVRKLQKKIFPIRAEPIHLSNPDQLRSYTDYWKQTLTEWKQSVLNDGINSGTYERVKKIEANIGDLLPFLDDLNTQTVEILSFDNFSIIKKAIELRIKELERENPDMKFS